MSAQRAWGILRESMVLPRNGAITLRIFFCFISAPQLLLGNSPFMLSNRTIKLLLELIYSGLATNSSLGFKWIILGYNKGCSRKAAWCVVQYQ